MKTITKFTKPVLFFSILLMYLNISCNQDDSANVPLQKSDSINYKDQFGQHEFKYDFYPESQNFAEIEKIIRNKTNTDLDKIDYILVFSDFRNADQLDINGALGISLIGFNEDNFVHRYYTQDISKWKNIIDLNLPLNYLYTLTFNLLTQYTLELHNTNNIFTSVFQNPDIKELMNSPRGNYHLVNLESILTNKLKDKNSTRFYFAKMEDDHNIYSIDAIAFLDRGRCTSACAYGSGPLCQPSSGSCGNHAEYEGGCKVNPIQNQINTKGIASSSFSFDQTKFYSIRDEVLANTDLGQEYINDYYTISQFINAEDLSFSTLSKIVNVAPKLYTAYNNYQANNGVIIDIQLKNELKSIMLDIKSLDSGNNYSSIIDKLVTDLETNTNKTRNQIDAFLAN